MSEALAKVKEEEIQAIEKQEEEEIRGVIEDRCPNCGTFATKFKYMNKVAIRMFGWIECTVCGVVFCPASIRRTKLEERGSLVSLK